MILPRVTPIVFLILALCACVTGRRSEDKTGLDRLNGETYYDQDSASLMERPVLPVYVGDQKPIPTKISGEVWSGEGIESKFAGSADVELHKVQGDSSLASARTDGVGNFKIFQVLSNGSYFLKVSLAGRDQWFPIEVKGYEVRGLKLHMGPSERGK